MNVPPAPVGADVHYVNGQGICRAATVTASEGTGSENRDLRIHHQAEMADRRAARFGGRGEPGHLAHLRRRDGTGLPAPALTYDTAGPSGEPAVSHQTVASLH
jgi:hypothetical protein